MRGIRGAAIALMGVLASVTLDVTGSIADDYPSRPITIIVPFAAGGPTDVVARIMAEGMRTSLGQTVIIENITGAAGSIAVGRAVRATPDGYTLSIGHWSTHVVNGAIYNLPYDLLADLAPVSLLVSNPQLIVANPNVPATDLKSLVAWIKANPDRVSAGTAGPGSASHIGGIYFQNFSHTSFLFVPYRGTGPAMQDLIGGQIQIMLDQSSNSLPQVRNKQIKAFAVTSKTRLAVAPDIPTVDEVGLPGFYISGVARAVGAEGHAEADYRQTCHGRARRARRSGHAKAASRSRSGNPSGRSAKSGSACRLSEGRNRKMVAADQGGEYQAGVAFYPSSVCGGGCRHSSRIYAT